jgi:hypothetical protein
MSQQSSSSANKATAALGWYKTFPSTESMVITMANARQVALRERLRQAFWLTGCAPLGLKTVDLTCRWMERNDPKDTLTTEERSELLSEHYGFQVVADGWTIPDLLEAFQEAQTAGDAKRAAASKGGKARAANAQAAGGSQGGQQPNHPQQDF